MFTVHPPLPSPGAARALRRDARAMSLLIKLRADVTAAIRALEPETLLALARQYHPEVETDYQAAACFGLEVTDALRALAQHGEDVRSLSKAESDRLAPITSAACRRVLEIPRALKGVARSLKYMDASIEERRESLRKAGVKTEEIERVLAQGGQDRDGRRAALNAERTSLQKEYDSLGRFLKTEDEHHLPASFTIPETIKIEAPASKYLAVV